MFAIISMYLKDFCTHFWIFKSLCFWCLSNRVAINSVVKLYIYKYLLKWKCKTDRHTHTHTFRLARLLIQTHTNLQARLVNKNSNASSGSLRRLVVFSPRFLKHSHTFRRTWLIHKHTTCMLITMLWLSLHCRPSLIFYRLDRRDVIINIFLF